MADDHAIVREGLTLMLERVPDIDVVGEATDGSQTVQAVRAIRPDIVLMDIDMPVMSGIDATSEIVEANEDISVIMLTVHAREDLLSRSLEAGARGYIVKDQGVDELVKAIRTVHAGEVYISPPMATKLVEYLKRLKGDKKDDPYEKLSVRERQVLPMLAEGRSVRDVAGTLHLSPYTVQTYRQRIMQKLGIHGATELLKYALKRGLVRLDP